MQLTLQELLKFVALFESTQPATKLPCHCEEPTSRAATWQSPAARHDTVTCCLTLKNPHIRCQLGCANLNCDAGDCHVAWLVPAMLLAMTVVVDSCQRITNSTINSNLTVFDMQKPSDQSRRVFIRCNSAVAKLPLSGPDPCSSVPESSCPEDR